MHTDDAQDIVTAATNAGLLSRTDGRAFMDEYHALRDEKERAAAKRWEEHSTWFDRILLWRIPVIGVPAFLAVIVAYAIIEAVTR